MTLRHAQETRRGYLAPATLTPVLVLAKSYAAGLRTLVRSISRMHVTTSWKTAAIALVMEIHVRGVVQWILTALI